MWLCRIWFMHSSGDQHVGRFHVSGVVKDDVSTGGHVRLSPCVPFFWAKTRVWELHGDARRAGGWPGSPLKGRGWGPWHGGCAAGDPYPQEPLGSQTPRKIAQTLAVEQKETCICLNTQVRVRVKG